MSEPSDSGSAARQLAVKLLAAREHSADELRHKLSRRGYADEVIDQALQWCRQHDLQSDHRFAEAYAKQRAGRLYGPLIIQAELRQKGVADELINEALADLEDQWLDAAIRFLGKRRDDLSQYQQRGKAYQALCRKGFSSDIARQAIDACQSMEES